MRHFLPLIAFLAATSALVAEEPVAVPAPAATGAAAEDPSAAKGRMREIERKLAELRQTALKDPEVAKLKAAADEARKAYEAKADQVTANGNPEYAQLKAELDALRTKGKGDKGERGEKGRKKDKPEGR